MAKKKKGGQKKADKNTWSARDIDLLKKLFPNTPTSKIAPKVGRAVDAVKKKAARMGLKKSKAYLKKIGR